MTAQQNLKDLNLAEMSDDDIMNFDADRFETGQAPTANEQPQDPPVRETETEDTDAAATGGAGAADESSGTEEDVTGSTSVEESTETVTADPFKEGKEQAPAAHQAAEPAEPPAQEEETASSKLDYKAEYLQLMAPFKAAKREIRLNNIDDARRLMQMGVDYSRKMEAMKPYQRVLQTLEKNNLLNVERLNFLIDLDKKNPEAIKKFLKDSEIDPMDLSLEDNTPYKPNDHMVAEQEVALNEVLEDIRHTDTFDRLAKVVSEEWDTASRKILYQDPRIIRALNDNIQSGVFDQIVEEMDRERILGRLVGLSDLEAYKAVGDAIQARKGWRQPTAGNESSTGVQPSQKSGSEGSAKAEELRNRRRAASSPKGTPSAGHKKVDLAKLSDEEIEKLDINAL